VLGQKLSTGQQQFRLMFVAGFIGGQRMPRRDARVAAVLSGGATHDSFEGFTEGAFGFVAER
jgi:hypothetical protein